MCQQWNIQAEHMSHGMRNLKAESRANRITKFKVESVKSQSSYTSCLYICLWLTIVKAPASFFFKGICVGDFCGCPLSMTSSGK